MESGSFFASNASKTIRMQVGRIIVKHTTRTMMEKMVKQRPRSARLRANDICAKCTTSICIVFSFFSYQSHFFPFLRFHFHFQCTTGFKSKYRQNIKIRFSIQNSRIPAVSTPNLTAKAAFFRVFRNLFEKLQKMRENLKNRRNPSHQISENFGKSRNFVIF